MLHIDTIPPPDNTSPRYLWVHFWRTVPQGFKSGARKPRAEEKMCVPEKDAAVLGPIPPRDITWLIKQ